MDEFERTLGRALREAVPEPPTQITVADVMAAGHTRGHGRVVGLLATVVIVAAIALLVAVLVPDRPAADTGDSPGTSTVTSTASPTIHRRTSTRSGSLTPIGLTGPPNITATITERPPPLLPADYTGTGTAHGCYGYVAGPVVTITMNPDGAAPGCVIVRAGQRLKIINNQVAVLHGAAQAVHLTFAGQPAITIPIGQDLVINRPFGEYLLPGQHFIRYDTGSNIDIWLK